MDKKELRAAVRSMETLELNELERKGSGYSFIALPSGITRYELKGEGAAVVLVHGYATPYHIYDKLFDALIEAGYRVLRYDLLGRGYSERVQNTYSPELFAKQLDEITSALLGDEGFVLVGTSMGGSICAAYTAQYPQRVKRLVLLAPAGMDSLKPPLYMKICRLRGVGGLVFYNVASKLLLKKCASEMLFSTQDVDYYMRQFADAARYKGFLRCTLSSLRSTILNTSHTATFYEKIGKTELPVLCIWGTLDKTMPYYQAQRFKELCPRARLVTYEGSGHIFVYDEGERTAKDVLKFIEIS